VDNLVGFHLKFLYSLVRSESGIYDTFPILPNTLESLKRKLHTDHENKQCIMISKGMVSKGQYSNFGPDKGPQYVLIFEKLRVKKSN